MDGLSREMRERKEAGEGEEGRRWDIGYWRRGGIVSFPTLVLSEHVGRTVAMRRRQYGGSDGVISEEKPQEWKWTYSHSANGRPGIC